MLQCHHMGLVAQKKKTFTYILNVPAEDDTIGILAQYPKSES